MKKFLLLLLAAASSASAQIIDLSFTATFDEGPLTGTDVNVLLEVDTLGAPNGIADLVNGQINFIDIEVVAVPVFFIETDDISPSVTFAEVSGSPEIVGIDYFGFELISGDSINLFYNAFAPTLASAFTISYLPGGGTLGTANDESTSSTASNLPVNVPEASATLPILALIGCALRRRRA